jgi:hypothetical protein
MDPVCLLASETSHGATQAQLLISAYRHIKFEIPCSPLMICAQATNRPDTRTMSRMVRHTRRSVTRLSPELRRQRGNTGQRKDRTERTKTDASLNVKINLNKLCPRGFPSFLLSCGGSPFALPNCYVVLPAAAFGWCCTCRNGTCCVEVARL